MLAKDGFVDFLKDEDGAATIDFVVMTAAGVAMTVAASNAVRDTMEGLVDGIGTSVTAINTSTSFGGTGDRAGEGEG